MNKRLKEILKEYEKRKHKIIKGDESMNIVVLAGGTSTEREQCIFFHFAFTPLNPNRTLFSVE